MEFERLDLFHNNHGKMIVEIWSNDVPEQFKTYKPWCFKKATFL